MCMLLSFYGKEVLMISPTTATLCYYVNKSSKSYFSLLLFGCCTDLSTGVSERKDGVLVTGLDKPRDESPTSSLFHARNLHSLGMRINLYHKKELMELSVLEIGSWYGAHSASLYMTGLPIKGLIIRIKWMQAKFTHISICILKLKFIALGDQMLSFPSLPKLKIAKLTGLLPTPLDVSLISP